MLERLSRPPYSYVTFILFYKRGDLIQSIDCLKQGVSETSVPNFVAETTKDAKSNFKLSQFIEDIEIDL